MVTTDLPSPSDGPDPWCTWCDADVTAPPAFMIEGRDGGRWPPLFCSQECARRWGCAADEGRAYRVDEDHLAELLEWVSENTDLTTILDVDQEGSQ